MKIIPAIDLIDGKCVRLFQGDFNQKVQYSDDPLTMARSFADAGSTEIHVVDLDGAKNGGPCQGALIGEIASASGLKIQTGGGVRSADHVKQLIEFGASRVVIGSMALNDADTVKDLFQSLGSDSITLALDARLNESGVPMLATHGWQETSQTSIWKVIDGFLEVGLKHVLCTDISRDGVLQGTNVDLYVDMIKRYPEIHLQASGGVGSIENLRDLKASGIQSVIVGKALYEKRFTLQEAINC